MQPKGAINTIVAHAPLSKHELARSMGRSDNYFYNLLNRSSNVRIDVAAEIGDACGFDLLFRKRDDGSEVIIDPPKKDV